MTLVRMAKSMAVMPLTPVCARLRTRLRVSLRREGDLTARYADDCFAVLMGDASEAQAAEMAGRIAAKVRGLAIHHPRSMRDRFVTLSWGVASARPEGLGSRPDLIAQATEAMGSDGAVDAAAGNLA